MTPPAPAVKPNRDQAWKIRLLELFNRVVESSPHEKRDPTPAPHATPVGSSLKKRMSTNVKTTNKSREPSASRPSQNKTPNRVQYRFMHSAYIARRWPAKQQGGKNGGNQTNDPGSSYQGEYK